MINEEDRIKGKEIYQLSKGLTTTLQILVSDIRHAENLLKNDSNHEQFWRRIIVRSVCALGEGTLNTMKGMIPKTADFFGVKLTDKEQEIVSETKILADGKVKPFFLPIQDNLKATLKLFGRIHYFDPIIDYNKGYDDFCATFVLRNRLMHPRTQRELEVKNETYHSCVLGWNWFNCTVINLVGECGKRLPFSITK